MVFFRQLKSVLWKNFMIKLRHPVGLFLEFAFPLLVIIALWGIRLSLNSRITEQYIPKNTDYAPSIDDFYNYPWCGSEQLVWLCAASAPDCGDAYSDDANSFPGCKLRRIAVAPHDSSDDSSVSATHKFVAWANQTIPATSQNTLFVIFDSEKEFLHTIDKSSYSRIADDYIYSSLIVFESGYPKWDYTVRMNRSRAVGIDDLESTPQTRIDPVFNGVGTAKAYPDDGSTWYTQPYLNGYRDMGMFAVLETVNSFIATETCRATSQCTDSENVKLRVEGIADFPNVLIEEDIFWQALGSSFSILMVLSVLYPVSNVIKTLVAEKESKMREGMMMMSLRLDVIWTGWAIMFLCLFIPLSVFLMLVGQFIFVFSDLDLIFLYFISFFLAALAFCVLISIVFSKAKTASIFGSFIFFAGYIIYQSLVDTGMSRSQLTLACLHPSTAFCFGTLAFAEYEDSKIGVTSNTWDVSQQSPITFQDCIVMQFVNIAWMLALAWYLSQTWPSEYGLHKPWYFLLMPSYWSKTVTECCGTNQQQVMVSRDNSGEGVEMTQRGAGDEDAAVPIEDVPAHLKAQVGEKKCVHINNLRKSFNTATGQKVAVDGLNMTFYSGQITALLGHNGAGKSTAISMLTGLYPPDTGSATVQGFDIGTDMLEARKVMGVCPQHDVLEPFMTVEEHLQFFASVKGCPPEEIEQEVTSIIESVGLKDKRKEYSKNLSGGQKRKLSVAIAFVGKSKVVVLDEPTSGMDPFSRRSTWNVIRQHREGRVIILVTHFMDEADLLGDRIAIMGDGKLRCCGSPLFLKRIYGVGYNITVEKESVTDFDSKGAMDKITGYVPGSKLLTNVGTELSAQLPFTGSSGFQPLFEYLDDNMAAMGIKSYGMSVTTLEEVFLKVASGTSTIATAVTAMGGEAAEGVGVGIGVGVGVGGVDESKDGKKYQPVSTGDNDAGVLVVGSEVRDESKPLGDEQRDPESRQTKADTYELDESAKIGEGRPLEMFLQHMKALLTKRFLYFRRDTKAWGFQFMLPIIFVLAGCLIMHYNVWAPDQPSIVLSPTDYNTAMSSDFLPLPYTAADLVCPVKSDCNTSRYEISGQDYVMDPVFNSASFPMEPQYDAVSVYNISFMLLKDREEYRASRFGAITFTEVLFNDSSVNSGNLQSVKYVVHGNFTGVHAGPIYANIVADGVLRSIDPTASVTVRLHPLPETKKESQTLNSFNLTNLITLTIIAMAFIPAAFANFVMYEKESKCYHQQIVSGVSLSAYWLSTWLWDNLTYQLAAWLILIIIIVFPDTSLLTGQEPLGAFIGLFMLFGPAIIGFTYMTTFLFKTASSGQLITVFINLILGLGLTITTLVLRFIPSTHDLHVNVLRYIFVLFPPCALGEGMNNLALRNFYSDLELGGNKHYDVLDWNICGLNLLVLGIEGIVFIVATIATDYVASQPQIRNLLDPKSDLVEGEGKDDDVTGEEEMVAAKDDRTTSSAVLIQDVKKKYSSGTYAVKGVSLAIPHGECFGLLGVNGAGKSSLLNILSGEYAPTTGNAFLASHSVVTDMPRCRYHIGFCPQFDAIYDLLSAREHLELYAAIKGIRAVNIANEVNHKIRDLGLTEYVDRAAGGYSGGNKRKLSVAMAMVAEPSILFLDEPSTGMDPMARRFMWEVISDLVTRREKCSLILTTHSMEECEALCTRIGIMVGGVMKCLGSSQHLRSRYGLGYQMEILFEIPDDATVADVSSALRAAAQLPESASGMTEAQMKTAFEGCGYSAWLERITATGTGLDVRIALDNNGEVTFNHLASWCVLEARYDTFLAFLGEHFDGYKMRERQMAKVRVEIPSMIAATNTHRRLSSMFGLMESNVKELGIREYSVAQTSLEQIFNSFAAEQQEDHNAAEIGGLH